jgi:segregation and condensation protein B
LETLAILAYKQPVSRAEIEELRGVDVSGVLSTLLERGFIKIVGKKEVPGRPFLYGTTEKFLEHFGLKSLTDLPSIGEIRTLVERAVRKEELLGESRGEPTCSPAPDVTNSVPETNEDSGHPQDSGQTPRSAPTEP